MHDHMQLHARSHAHNHPQTPIHMCMPLLRLDILAVNSNCPSSFYKADYPPHRSLFKPTCITINKVDNPPHNHSLFNQTRSPQPEHFKESMNIGPCRQTHQLHPSRICHAAVPAPHMRTTSQPIHQLHPSCAQIATRIISHASHVHR